jgi:hypothetical protein
MCTSPVQDIDDNIENIYTMTSPMIIWSMLF